MDNTRYTAVVVVVVAVVERGSQQHAAAVNKSYLVRVTRTCYLEKGSEKNINLVTWTDVDHSSSCTKRCVVRLDIYTSIYINYLVYAQFITSS